MSAPRFDGFGPDAFGFLRAIGFHQSREWFSDNRKLYESQLREPLIAFCTEAAERARSVGLDMTFDSKKGPFRINRDVRFAKEKHPYNQHVSAVLSRDGTKKAFGVLYVHVGLEEQFFAAGYWALPKEELDRFRRSAIARPDRYADLVQSLQARGLGWNDEGALKRLPRGWDDPGSALLRGALRLRGFTVSRHVDEAATQQRQLLDRFETFARDTAPLFEWGVRVLT